MRREVSYAGMIDPAHAMRAGWIEFWYQPKIDLRRNAFVGVEMFARVRHPFHGMLPAAVFLNSASKSSLAQLAVASVHSALRAAQSLGKRTPTLPVTINVPGFVLTPEFIASLETILSQHQPESEKRTELIFDVHAEEITREIPRFSQVAADLAPLGIKLAANDFGEDLRLLIQSDNLAAVKNEIEQLSKRLLELKTMEVFELKLDRKLVIGCTSDPQRLAMVSVLVDLIHHVGSAAVAVGLENADDVVSVRKMNCDLGQGYYFCEPKPLDQFLEFLAKDSKKKMKTAMSSK
jgi:EAL domain-containing protein (putative c-di-GMP-specific phosphodiesterase class I)